MDKEMKTIKYDMFGQYINTMEVPRSATDKEIEDLVLEEYRFGVYWVEVKKEV